MILQTSFFKYTSKFTIILSMLSSVLNKFIELSRLCLDN